MTERPYFLQESLISILKEFSLEEVLAIEENFDEQYIVLEKLYYRLKNPPVYLSLIVLNAISSYQLNCTGEKYWSGFSEYFSKKRDIIKNIEVEGKIIVNMFLDFLEKSRCNVRLLRQKRRRVMRVVPLINSFIENISVYVEDFKLLQLELSKHLNTSISAKTVVFAVKMFNYGVRIAYSKKIPLPFDIDIPVDNRIKKISSCLGVSEEDIKGFWRKVAYKTEIPPLHIDSLLWVAYRYAKEGIMLDNSKFNKLILFLKSFLVN